MKPTHELVHAMLANRARLGRLKAVGLSHGSVELWEHQIGYGCILDVDQKTGRVLVTLTEAHPDACERATSFMRENRFTVPFEVRIRA